MLQGGGESVVRLEAGFRVMGMENLPFFFLDARATDKGTAAGMISARVMCVRERIIVCGDKRQDASAPIRCMQLMRENTTPGYPV